MESIREARIDGLFEAALELPEAERARGLRRGTRHVLEDELEFAMVLQQTGALERADAICAEVQPRLSSKLGSGDLRRSSS